jgi:glyoxylase-like metal-dependent hydrolase (beta-lactamase superfamily II)
MVFRGLGEKRVMEALGGLEQGPVPPDARPTLSFNDRMNLAWNGDLIHMVHMPGAHSDGDAMVHFRDADVVHTGDLFFNVHYPFIDVDYGGNLEGMVRALENIQAHTLPTALYIPGHGPLATRSELEAYTDMLRTVAQRVRAMVDEGRTREEVIQARPTAEFDEAWGADGGFAIPDFWVGLVYDGMVRRDGSP